MRVFKKMRVLTMMAAAGLMATTMGANAAIVTQWDYSVSTNFDVTTGGNVGLCIGTACYENNTTNQTSSSTKLSWGVPFPPENPGGLQSSLEITGSPARSPGFGGAGAFLNTCIN